MLRLIREAWIRLASRLLARMIDRNNVSFMMKSDLARREKSEQNDSRKISKLKEQPDRL